MAETSVDTGSVIRVMPEGLANKIAAGEVVQRPAAAAKELLENAMDAGADAVQLVVKKAGRELVQVVDDGCGMSRADAERCFRRHATSKIRSVEDLERIRTLGFRGEALASIAAVAQVELKTRRAEDAAGTRVRVNGGEVVAVEPCAVPPGTSVAVRNLFYNVPVRRNFLKTPATEFKHLVETFQRLALAHPAAAFTLTHNDHEVYDLAAARSPDFFAALQQRIGGLLGEDRARHLMRVEEEASYLSVRGFASAPAQRRRGRDEQFLFVNGRHVESRYLAHAVRTAYGDLLPDDAFPPFALFLTLDPRRVDVNVHPTKAEVKFDDQSGVYGFLRGAVRAALGAQDLTPQLGEARAARPGEKSSDEECPAASPRPRPLSFRAEADEDESPRSARGASSRGAPPFEARAPEARRRERPASGVAPGEASRRLYESEEETPAAAPERPVWQLGRAYVVTRAGGDLLVVDQQAAHQRVLFERARRLQAEEKQAATQQLLFPRTVELPVADAELVRELLPDLRALGFDLDLFSGRTVAVRGVPAGLREGDEEALLAEVLVQFKENRAAESTKPQDNLARSLAQRGAVRTGQPLAEAEMRALLADLFRCEMPYVDPSGRDTLWRLSKEELDERFGR